MMYCLVEYECGFENFGVPAQKVIGSERVDLGDAVVEHFANNWEGSTKEDKDQGWCWLHKANPGEYIKINKLTVLCDTDAYVLRKFIPYEVIDNAEPGSL